MSLFVRKPMNALLNEAEETGTHTLKRTLGAGGLIALGIGAIIGAGLFSITGMAAANHAGPAITISFVVAALGCLFAGLCYAEFASMIPVAGSAYTYSYATMGEFIAWIIGWDLVLEYAVGAATVGISWSRYLVKFLEGFDVVSTAAQEAKNPKKDMPWGILGSLAICTVLYILFAHVMTGVTSYTTFA